jgi:hypothetical protein
LKDLLRRYTELRISSTKAEDEAQFQQIVKESEGVQARLWAHAGSAAADTPTAITASFITTLNETIDLQSSRLAARSNHVPGAVWILLMVVSGCGAWASGYGSGTGGQRSAFSQIVFPVLIGIVITLIADIDRPNKGLIGVNQKPMEDLYRSMTAPSS